jgi:hypothetical protein
MGMDDKIKAIFFAQYWGLPVLKFPIVDERSPNALPAEVDTNALPSWALYKEYSYYSIRHGYLLLRSIEQLTDEEVYQVNVMCQWGYNEFEYLSVENNRSIRNMIINSINRDVINISVVDYLRSIGILLSFTYLDETNQPQTLTPSQIIELGWCKIKDLK